MNVPWRDRRGRFLWLKAVVLLALLVPGICTPYGWPPDSSAPDR
jgi:hypothetical protein